MMLQVLILVLTLFTAALGSNFASCQSGWEYHLATTTATCLWLSEDYAKYLSGANSVCNEKNSSLVIVDTEEKFKLLNEHQPYASKKLWFGLQKENKNFYWLTKGGKIPAHNIPFTVSWDPYNDDNGVILSNGYTRPAGFYEQFGATYVCEYRPSCKGGWFGLGCDRECHCYNEECDPTSIELKCSFGCEIGWMGDDCSQKKEDAEVRYFCVNSDDQGKYAHVIIETKGVEYDNINPVNSQGEWMSWCNNTIIYEMGNNTSITHIKTYIDDSTLEDIKDGICAGQITNTGSYEWKLKIQEHDGLVSRNDQEMSIECDFAGGDKFILSTEVKIKRESTYRKANIKRPIAFLEEKKEQVKLELIDPSKNTTVNRIVLGSSVALRISFGIHKENVATGVRPFNCKASSPDNENTAMFLDNHGCSMNGYPISEFHTSGAKTLMTNPFPLFGFDGSKEVEFHCLYSLCFKNEQCETGCDAHGDQSGRFRRSIDEESLFIKSTIQVLHP